MAHLISFKISPKGGHLINSTTGNSQFYVLPETIIEFEVSKHHSVEIIITVDGHYYNGKFYACLEDMFIDLPEDIMNTIIFNLDIFKNL